MSIEQDRGLAGSDAIILAATPDGIHRSIDWGHTWERALVHGAHTPIEVLGAGTASNQMDRTVWAGAIDGIYRWNSDEGVWQRALASSRVYTLGSCSASSSGSKVLLAGTELDGIFRSNDAGSSWRSANAGLIDFTVLSLAAPAVFGLDAVAFAGTASGVARTVNGGKSWQTDFSLSVDVAVQTLMVSPHFESDRTVLGGTERHGVIRSDDAGMTWDFCGEIDAGVTALAFLPFDEPADDRSIVAGTADGLYLSRDAGNTWEPLGVTDSPVLSIALHCRPSETLLFVGTQDDGLFISRWESKENGHAFRDNTGNTLLGIRESWWG